MARSMNCTHVRGLAQYVLASHEVAQGPPRCSQLSSASLLSLQVARVSRRVRAARWKQMCPPTKAARINGTVALFSIIPSPDCFARAVESGRNRPVYCGLHINSQLGYHRYEFVSLNQGFAGGLRSCEFDELVVSSSACRSRAACCIQVVQLRPNIVKQPRARLDPMSIP